MVKHLNKVKKEEYVGVKTEPVGVQQPEKEETKGPLEFAKKKKHHRIIIRNLVVDVNENIIRKLCSPFGEIQSVQIPMHPLKKCSRGFAFVEFTKKNMCLKAIRKLNAKPFKGRVIVVDTALSKDVYLQFKEELDKNPERQAPEFKLTKPKVQQKPLQEEPTQTEQDPNGKKQKLKKPKVKEEVNIKQEQTESRPVEDLSATVFLRNLSSTTTQKQIFSFAKRFGKLKFVKVVVDPETNECRGSAFVKFHESAPAQRLIQYSREFEMAQSSKLKHFAEDPEINLEIQGRIIKIFPAQSRTQLTTRIQSRDSKQKKASKPLQKIRNIEQLIGQDKNSKRHLHLALQGFWKSENWMKREELERFQTHESEKLEKLKNPNNQVSQTRMVLKYLPKELTEQNLRQICQTFLQEKYPSKHKTLTCCKLMLDRQRNKSTGVGFVEFASPTIAISFLKWLGDVKKEVFDGASVLFQFVIQDARKMQKINDRSKKIKKAK